MKATLEWVARMWKMEYPESDASDALANLCIQIAAAVHAIYELDSP